MENLIETQVKRGDELIGKGLAMAQDAEGSRLITWAELGKIEGKIGDVTLLIHRAKEKLASFPDGGAEFSQTFEGEDMALELRQALDEIQAEVNEMRARPSGAQLN